MIKASYFHRVNKAAQRLLDGESVFTLDEWHLETGGASFKIWPWTIVQPETLENGKTYIATLRGERKLTIHLKMAFGLERILTPASALIPLFTLSSMLDASERTRLGATLRAMNVYYKTPEGASRLMSEVKALQAALPVLLN